MKSIIKITLIVAFLIFNAQFLILKAQVGINEDGSQPNASALLDVKSTTKGILIPRMTTTQRTTINSPATGLMVFDNTTNSFWFYNGTAWTEIKTGATTVIQDADSNTKIQVEESADENKVRIDLAGSERVVMEQSSTGATLINLPNNNHNLFIGEGAGLVTPLTGFGKNHFIGYQTGQSNTSGHHNIFNGYYAGRLNTTGYQNVFTGAYSGNKNTSGIGNTFIGYGSGNKNTTGRNNIFIGFESGSSNTTGQQNTYVGYQTGLFSTGSNNVFLGHYAGFWETGSNKLYIDNSNSSTPLIYGDFANDTVKIYGTLGIKNAYTFPVVDGTTGQILQTDGSGNTSWATPTANTDNQDLSLSGNTLSLTNDGTTVDLAAYLDNTDNQKTDIFQLNGNNLELSLENDGIPTQSIDFSSLNATKTLIEDADNDTKIQVEESADEDKIRFDLGGSERVVIRQSTTGATLINLPNNNENTFLGQDAGQATIQTGGGNNGRYNSFVGYQSGYSNTTGAGNVFNGTQTGYSNTTGNLNTFNGYRTGYSNTTGTGNVFNGYNAGFSNTTGHDNTFNGYNAGYSNTTGGINTFSGAYAGYFNTTGIANTFSGTRAGYSNTSGYDNTFNGYKAGFSNTTGGINTFSGAYAGYFNTTGSGNTFSGTRAGYSNTTGSNNIFNGHRSGYSNTSGIRNVFSGYQSGHSNTTGNSNVINGYQAGYSNTIGTGNVFNGTYTGYSNTTGNLNTFNGHRSGYSNTTGVANTFNGTNTGYSNTSGYDNTFNGYNAGYSNTTGGINTFSGAYAGYFNTTGLGNTFSGTRAGYSNTTGANNTFNGHRAGYSNTTGVGNVFSGYQAGFNETGSNKLYIENSNSTTPLIYGEFDNDIVKINGRLLITNGFSDADNDTKIQVEESADEDKIRFDLGGSESMIIEKTTNNLTQIEFPNNNDNILLGGLTGESLTTGKENVFMGGQAGQFTTTGQYNVYIGKYTGQNMTTGSDNVMIGMGAGSEGTTGSNNTFIGKGAGENNYAGNGNTFLGFSTGSANHNGNRNTYIGYGAGNGNTSQNNNTYLGYQAGLEGDGSNNIFLGYQAAYNETGSNKLYIENSNSNTPLIYGDFANDTVKIYGTLGIKNVYTFPIVDGTTGQILQTDGSGNTSWATLNPNTDNQKTDVFQLNGTNLELSLENDGITTQSIDLSSLNTTKTLIADADNDTKIQVEESADEDKIRFDLGGSERLVIEQNTNGITLIHTPNNSRNTLLGEGAGQAILPVDDNGDNNTFVGYKVGFNNTEGFNNVFYGYESGYSTTTGNNNTFSGFIAGYANTTGSSNAFFGGHAGRNSSTGYANTFVGGSTGFNSNGDFNTYLGYSAGHSNTSGSGNIFLGYQAGRNETGSNKLYIENSNSVTPLIYGDFANDTVKIYGTLGIKNAYTFPIVDGTNGQILQTDGSGNTSWATPTANTDNQKIDVFQLNGTNLELSLENDGIPTQSIDLSSLNATKTLIADADNDTKIQVEESADDDKIRFDLGGSEQVVMEKNTAGNTMLNFPNNNGNLLIGNQAGQNEAGSNKLYIENSNSSSPLIYGEFDNDAVTINGTLTATGIYLPSAFAPDNAYVGSAGNYIAFGHLGISEDFLGYKNNTFYFRDSPNGGDNTQPSVYAAAFPTYSSRRWKHNIKDLDNALSIIQQLQGVTYTWDEDHGGADDFGFIAEEVNEILPEIAPKNTQGEVDGVEYGQLTPYLVEAIKEQQTIIENQNQKIQQLEQQVKKIDKLETMLEQLQMQFSVKK